MSQPWGYEYRDEGGLRGLLARWWLRRRTKAVRAALDELRRR